MLKKFYNDKKEPFMQVLYRLLFIHITLFCNILVVIKLLFIKLLL